jgi:hypothetical protein
MTAIAERASAASSISKLVILLLGDTEKQVRAQAIVSLRRLNPDGAFELLADRLSQETQVVLQKQLLSALSQQRSIPIVDKLLTFVPPVELIEVYSRAMVFQIANDVVMLSRVVDALSLRQSYQTALLLVRAFPLENISVEGTADVNRLHAKVLSQQLLKQGLNESNALFFDDALLRLNDLQLVGAGEGMWFEYEIKLRLLRGDVQLCIEQMLSVAGSDISDTAKWTLALDVMSAAVEQQIDGAVESVRLAMQAAGALPAELEFRASQLFDISTPPQLRDDNAEQDQSTTE